MKYIFISFLCLWNAAGITAMVTLHMEKNISNVAIALSEIINAMKPPHLTILALYPSESRSQSPMLYQFGDCMQKDVDDFICQLHRLNFKTIIYYDADLFFQYIESSLQGSIESVNLIFAAPYQLSQRIQQRKLAHRLSLFIFYWGAKYPPKAEDVHFEEPIRAVVITRPRKRAFRVYYNQAIPDGVSNLRLINWYDGDNLGLHRIPVLPNSASVYADFKGRIFKIPVFHSPPWFWVNYGNDSIETNATGVPAAASYPDDDYAYFSVGLRDDDSPTQDYPEVNVTGGRDHRLIKLLAERMNFQFVYIDTPGRTQGSLRADAEGNDTFTGAIGLLQNGEADFLLGDVGLSWERSKVVEFSFFTLADSGAFATHASRRLNEAFAIVRPFKMDVWPYLILTIIFSGPILYCIIALPYRWHVKSSRGRHETDVERVGDLLVYMVYIREITMPRKRRLNEVATNSLGEGEMPANLFNRCIWFMVQLFLKQSCHEVYHGYRAKFLMIVYWIAGTYVLADVYSAQLTSQFAQPPHEAPINTLHRLQKAMLLDGYKLYVEKESSSLEMLENGTEIFRQLYALMKRQQSRDDVDGFLIDSVEDGIKLIADGMENKAVLAGRETLYFNIQQYGSKTFQLSQKLYTRYSAVAVQIGCPFLDSLNSVLIRLFEGGILDKMTHAEYAAQSRMIGQQSKNADKGKGPKPVDESKQLSTGETAKANTGPESAHEDDGPANSNEPQNTLKTGNHDETQMRRLRDKSRQTIQPLNLRMLQGAFIVLLCGYGTAVLFLFLELLQFRSNFDGAACIRKGVSLLGRRYRHLAVRISLHARRLIRAIRV